MIKAFKFEIGKSVILDYYDSLLENLTIPYERLNIDTNYGNTFILAAGKLENPPMVLLHGSSMNSAMWIGDIQKLSDNYRIYAPDIPGEPGRSDERQFPIDTLDYSNWLLDVFNALKIDKAILIGASLGAFFTIKFSVNHSDRVNKLVLLCPAGVGFQNQEFKSIAMSLLTKGEKGLNELLAKINGDNPIPEVFLNYQKLIGLFFNSRQETIPIFTDDELKKLTMPCILFVGGKDIMLRSDEIIKRFSELVPHAERVMLKDKGHSLSGLSDEITEFLNNLRVKTSKKNL